MTIRDLGATLLSVAAVALLSGPLSSAQTQEATGVHLKETEPHTVAVMRHQGPYTDIPQVADELTKALDKNGYYAAGPLMAAYFNDPNTTPQESLLWEIRIPVANPGLLGTVENDRMTFKYFDPFLAAYTYHIGPFDKVGGAYMRIVEWIQRNKYEIMGPPVEVYWSDPQAVPPERLVTEIQFPVLEKETPDIVK